MSFSSGLSKVGKMRNKELHNFYSLEDIIRVIN